MKNLVFTILFMVIFLSISSTVYAAAATCNSCSDCTSKLNGVYTIVKLSQDITADRNPCVEFKADNIVFDCIGKKIMNQNNIDSIGIRATDRRGIIIQNCILTSMGSPPLGAILLTNTNNSKILNNKIYGARDQGIHLTYSNNNEINNNIVLDVGSVGIYVILGSNNNAVRNNIVKRAPHYGICSCLDVVGNIIENNSVVYSGSGPDGGICLCGNSRANTMNNNFVCYNKNNDMHVCTDTICNGVGRNNVCNNIFGPWSDVGYTGCTFPCICIFNPFGSSVDGRCHVECGAVENCDNLPVGSYLPYCNCSGTLNYFGCKCAGCNGYANRDKICRSAGSLGTNDGCTAPVQCNGKTAGRSWCDGNIKKSCSSSCSFSQVDCTSYGSGYYCLGGACLKSGTGGGGCPYLKAWDGNDFKEIELLNIHAPKDQDTTYTSSFSMQSINDKYELILHEAAYLFWDGSHINSIKLVDNSGMECKLISAVHSKQGDVLQALKYNDNDRVRSYPGEEIKLVYDECSGNDFTFTIEGYNMKTPYFTLPYLLSNSAIIISLILILIEIIVIILIIRKLSKKHSKKRRK